MDYREVLKAQTVLDRKYRIDRVIGAGGFGITYQAFDLGLAAPVAIKEYYPSQFGIRDSSLSVRARSDNDRPLFDRLRASFLREARTLAQFDHPAIVRVLSVFETHGTAYMVMRFESGASLKVWLKELDRAPTQAELDRLLGPLLDAIHVMHAADFLHRDIAPDNIIVRADGTPVLLDFGASRRVVTDMSGTLTGVVKQGYSPQEQYSSDTRSQGPWTDIYSLGATLYLAVTGRVPTEATARMLEDGMMPAAEGARGNYRPTFLAAIDSAMRLRPRERPQSVAEWREMLFQGADAGWYASSPDGMYGGSTGPGGPYVPSSGPVSGPSGRSSPRAQSLPRASAPRYGDQTGPRSAPGLVSAPRSGSFPSTGRGASDTTNPSLPADGLSVPPSMGTRASDFAFSTRGAIVLGIGAMLIGGSMLLAFENPERRGGGTTISRLAIPGSGTGGNSGGAAEAEARRREAARQAEAARQQEEARKAAEAEARRREAARQAEAARKQEEARKAAEAEARRREAARQAEAARKQEEARKAAEAEARRQEAARQAEAARKQEEARKAAEAEARRQEAARQAELARQQEEARKAAEAEARRQEAARQAELARQQEEARKAAEAEARRQETARRAEIARLQAETLKAVEAEARRQEAARQAELARQQDEARKAAEAEAARQQQVASAATAITEPSSEQRPVASGAASARGPATDVPAQRIVFADPGKQPGAFAQYLAATNGGVLAGGSGGSLKLWSDGKSDFTDLPATGTSPIVALSALDDSDHAVSGSIDGSLRIWDLGKREALHTIAGEGSPVVALKYRSRTRVVALFANGKWLIAQPESGEVLMSGTKSDVGGITSAQFADEGKIVFAAFANGAEGHAIEGWVPSDGGVTRVTAKLTGHTGRITTLAASANGELVASASDDGTVRLWRVDGARELARLEVSGGAPVRSLAFSASGKLVAGAEADGTVDVWQTSDGQRIASYRGTEDGLQAAVFSTDGAGVVASGLDGVIRKWLLPAAFVIQPPVKDTKPEPAVAVVPKPKIERPSREERSERRRQRAKHVERPERRRVRERREAPQRRSSSGGGGVTVRVPTF